MGFVRSSPQAMTRRERSRAGAGSRGDAHACDTTTPPGVGETIIHVPIERTHTPSGSSCPAGSSREAVSVGRLSGGFQRSLRILPRRSSKTPGSALPPGRTDRRNRERWRRPGSRTPPRRPPASTFCPGPPVWAVGPAGRAAVNRIPGPKEGEARAVRPVPPLGEETGEPATSGRPSSCSKCRSPPAAGSSRRPK
jgi:hypothetical protein